MTLTTYLLLDGQCKTAMEFYQSCFGGELTMTLVGASPMKNFFPATHHDRVLNAKLTTDALSISASDWLHPTEKPLQGNTVCLYLSGGPAASIRNAFERLSAGANITDPLKEEPFGLYGALNDQFGIRWMFHTDQG
jgi:PhnB protein